LFLLMETLVFKFRAKYNWAYRTSDIGYRLSDIDYRSPPYTESPS
jgi:hypothetical protein